MGMITEWRSIAVDEIDTVQSASDDELADWLERTAMDATTLDLDKQWHALHAAITGTLWETGGPGGRAVLGGTEFGEDLGYGPSRLLTAAEVAQVAGELDAIGPEGFAAQIPNDALRSTELYPSGVEWTDPDEREWLESSFDQLRAFYRSAADQGRAVVIVIT